MILNVGKNHFENVFKKNKQLELPILWNGRDFDKAVTDLFNSYTSLFKCCGSTVHRAVKDVCDKIIKSIKEYLDGFPATAFNTFSKVMNKAMEHPLRIYQKTGYVSEEFLELYRIRQTNENRVYKRREIFHVPYSARSKVKSCRYSIAGYPSLYLSTNLELCVHETKNVNSNYTIASLFKLDRNYQNHLTDIKVIELAVKPQSFFNEDGLKNFNELNLQSATLQDDYCLWYPIIAACSFIRANKDDHFAPEYIIPQLLMQWLRNYNRKKENKTLTKICDKYNNRCNGCQDTCKWNVNNELYGVRYFSCASKLASNLGFNYVFPVSSEANTQGTDYCKILPKVFVLNKPIYLHEYDSLKKFTSELNSFSDSEFDYIETT